MFKSIVLWVGLAGLILAACSPAATPTATPGTFQAPKTTPQLAGTATAVSPDPSQGTSDCTVVSVVPTPDATEIAATSLFKPVTDADWIRGPKTAIITFLEYADFECPACAALSPVLDQIQKQFPDEVRIVYRHFPSSSYAKDLISTQAAEAAGLQGKFWEMHDLLFHSQQDWISKAEADFETWLKVQAAGISGLDVETFMADMKSDVIVKKAASAQEETAKIGIPGTPFMLINGRIYQGPRDLQNLTSVVRLFMLAEKQFSGCPKMTINPKKQYYANIKTTKGDFVMQLFADKAPIAVNSFVFLARNGWYNGVIFHRVIPNFVAQAGDPSGTGFGGPGYSFADEIWPDLKFDQPGRVGMANSGPGTNGSQFFIIYTPQSNLDGNNTIFGQVTKGMDVVKQLTARDPSKATTLPEGDKIISVIIEEK